MDTSVKTHKKELDEVAIHLNFKEEVRELSKLRPAEYFEEVISHCFKV